MKKGLSYSGKLFPKDLSSEKHIQVIYNFIYHNLIPKLEELNKSTEINFVKGGIRNPPIYDLFSISSTAVRVKRNSPKTTVATGSPKTTVATGSPKTTVATGSNLFEAFKDLFNIDKFKDKSKIDEINTNIKHVYDSIVLSKEEFNTKYQEEIDDGIIDKGEFVNVLDNISFDFQNDNPEIVTKLKQLIKSRVKFKPTPSNSISKEDELRTILNVPKEISTLSSSLQPSNTSTIQAPIQAPIQTTIDPGLRTEIFIPAGTVMINLDGSYTKLNMDYILGSPVSRAHSALGSVPIQGASTSGLRPGTTSLGLSSIGPSVLGPSVLGSLGSRAHSALESTPIPGTTSFGNLKPSLFYYPELVKDSPTYVPAGNAIGTAMVGTTGDYAAYGTPGYHYVWSSPVSNSDLYYTYNPGGAVRGQFGWSPGT
jgi:hypothetical protein